MLIVIMDIRVDGIGQIAHAQEVTAANLFSRQVSKPDVHQIQPGRAGRNEMQMEPRMALPPALNRRVFVRGVVVDDGVHVDIEWRGRVEQVEKLAKLLVPMARDTSG